LKNETPDRKERHATFRIIITPMVLLLRKKNPRSYLSRPLAVAAHNLHLVCLHRLLIIQLEGHILDEERPDIVAESVCVKVALVTKQSVSFQPEIKTSRRQGSDSP
jgi:hypothetical protein